MSAQQVACGRLVCDTNISSKELIRARSYDLTSKDEGGEEGRGGQGRRGGEEGRVEEVECKGACVNPTAQV